MKKIPVLICLLAFACSTQGAFFYDFENDPVGALPSGISLSSFDSGSYTTDAKAKSGEKSFRSNGQRTFFMADYGNMSKGIFTFDVFLEDPTVAKIWLLISDGAAYRLNIEMCTTYIRDNSSGSQFLDGSLSLNSWNHIAVNFDVTTNTFELFVNGISKGTRNMGAGAGQSLKSFGFQACPYGIHYYDNFRLFVEPTDCAQVINQGLGLPGDLVSDCKIDFKDFSALAQSWLECSDPCDPQCGAALGVPEPVWTKAIPGYYVVSLKAMDNSDKLFAKLGMYEFKADGTIATKNWTWFLDGSGNSGLYALSDRIIGTGNGQPAGCTDSDKYINGLSQHLGSETNLQSVDGTWAIEGRKIAINYADNSWEKWYISWEEPNNLYKIELYDASYLKANTACWLTSTFTADTRDANAVNGGFGFGCGNHPFTYAAPITQLKKDLSGCAISFATSGSAVNSISADSIAGFDSAFSWTSNNVLRYTYPGNLNLNVYAYLSMPVSNQGILARRTIYSTSHDFNSNGNIEDEVGHLIAGLQIVDANGDYRGLVGVQWAANTWVQSLFWLDNKSKGLYRTGVADMSVQTAYFSDTFEDVAVGQRPASGWYFGSPTGGSVSNERAYRGSNSLKLGKITASRSLLLDSDTYLNIAKGTLSFWVYPQLNADGVSGFTYLQSTNTGFYNINLAFTSNYIADYSTGTTYFYPSRSLSSNVWHKIRIDFDHTNGQSGQYVGQFTLYVDGVDLGTRIMGALADELSQTYGLSFIGSDHECTNYVDNFKLSDGYPDDCAEAQLFGYGLDGDVNGDCYVGINDLHLLVLDWLRCNNPSDPGCAGNW